MISRDRCLGKGNRQLAFFRGPALGLRPSNAQPTDADSKCFTSRRVGVLFVFNNYKAFVTGRSEHSLLFYGCTLLSRSI